MRFTPALRFFRRAAPVNREPDPADLGTAFGMEAILECDAEYQRANASAVEASELEAQRARAALESPLAWLSKRQG
jgi:hypothetical protein